MILEWDVGWTDVVHELLNQFIKTTFNLPLEEEFEFKIFIDSELITQLYNTIRNETITILTTYWN